MKTLGRSILLVSMALLGCPGLGLAQEPLGVVTTLSGQATRTASATPDAPASLRFKDGIFGADTIRTAERAFVRMLLERKAVLTVRELSVLRITEDATQATVDLRAGGIAFSVARPRLRPGEAVLIHTPNAVAAVRGTSIVVETQGVVSHFHVLTGTLDVASRANPTAWQRLQAPASLTVTGAVVGAARVLDAGTRERLSADYLGLRVSELSAPAEVVAQEQAKAVLLARLIGGDGGTGDGDHVNMLAVPEVSVAQAAPGMQSPTQVPVVPSVTPGAPAATPVAPPPPPLQSWNNQTATVTGDLYNVPGATTDSLGSGIASATGSTVTVTNEVVDVTGTLTATVAAPLLALQSSTLASRTLALVQGGGSLSLTGGALLDAVGGGVSTTDDLLRVMSGGGLSGPAAGPLLSLSGTALNVGNGAGDRLLELAGVGSRVNLAGALLSASGSAVSLTGTSLVEVSTGAALTTAGASPLVSLTGGTLVLNSAAGFLWSSATASTLGGGLLHTSGTDVNAAIASPGDLLRVTGPLGSPSTSPLFSLAGGNVRTRNLGVVSSAAGVLTLGGAFLDRSGTGNTLATTDDLLNVSAGGRLVAGGAAPLVRFTDTTVNVGNATGDQLFQLTGAGSAATLAGGLLEASNTALTLTGSALDVSTGAVLTATGPGPVAALSGGSLSLGAAVGFAVSSTGASQIAGSLLRTANTNVTTTSNLVSVSGSLADTGSAPLLDLTGDAVSARNGVVVSTANGRLTLNGPALGRAGGTLATTDDLLNVSGGGRLTNTGTGALLGFSNAAVNVGNASSDQLFVVTGAGSAATLAGSVLDASNTAFTLTGSVVEVSSGATLIAPSAAPLTALSGGALSLGGAAGFLVSSTSPSTIGGSLLRTTGADVTATGNLVTVSGSLTDTGTAALLDLTGGTVSARNGLAVSSANGRLGLNGPALSRTGGSLTVTDDLVSITAGGRLTDTGTGPLLILANGTLSVGNGGGDQLFVVNGAGSQATLAGPLLSATGSALSFTGTALVEVSSSSALTDTSAQRLVSLSGGTLTLGSPANAFLLNTSGTATLAGGLLDATGTDISAARDFVRVLGGGRIVVTGSTAPLLSLTGGTHQFGATGNIYRLSGSGTATAVDPVSGLTLGTAQPIQATGSLFEAVGATATTQRAVRLDVALLEASAPLLSLRANGAVASGLTTTSNTIDLTSRAKLNATAPVIALDGSRLTVTNASVVNVAGGSYLGVTGHLLSVANGSQLSVTNGTLLWAAGGSVVNISGALLSFGGAGSTVTVSNALCPCTLIGGIPVRLSGGALAGNVSIANAIQNAAGNTVSIAAGAAAIRVDGAATRVTISGQ
ncbi:MAG: FecR domain-containing protein [Candidatus Rokuibacteriota bacterium]